MAGELPQELGNLTLLEYFSVENSLSGSMPSSIFNITTMIYLDLSSNQFSGKIPAGLCDNLPHLQLLYLSAKKLERNLSMLRELYLGFSDLKGGIPANWGVSHSWRWPIPNQVGNCTSLKHLRLGYNYLTGELPLQLGSLASLETFTVFSNSLSGSIPPCIFTISTLKLLELSSNQFSGPLPPRPKFSRLTIPSA
ncbi:Receptor-like protein kinase 2 [Striga hermonthica]|uniref:Receptor-like protein kinase 2 n=1 Tax=Striga hermonthica TaxID=68872 RepID=A0A9N7NDM0_STRHE|nr:Receptor-like protein kinase 2 [Striga hermonthica]